MTQEILDKYQALKISKLDLSDYNRCWLGYVDQIREWVPLPFTTEALFSEVRDFYIARGQWTGK